METDAKDRWRILETVQMNLGPDYSDIKSSHSNTVIIAHYIYNMH